jgi:hypothetical protein
MSASTPQAITIQKAWAMVEFLRFPYLIASSDFGFT